MALVAKVYQEYEQIGTAYTGQEDGKNYINVMTENNIVKPVRVYTIEQYNFLLGMQFQKNKVKEKERKVAQSYNEERKCNAGFKNGHIFAVLGNTYKYKQLLKDAGAKFSTPFKWYFEDIPPVRIRYDFYIKKIYWEDVSRELETGAIVLKPTNEIEKLLIIEKPIDESTQFQGTKDALIERQITVMETKVIDGAMGRHIMHILEDKNHNIYVWNSAVSLMLSVGTVHNIEAIVVDHIVYDGKRQTILGGLCSV